MAFMVPFYTNEPFVRMTSGMGFDEFCCPADVSGMQKDCTIVERFEGKWFCRLSAPGYMDCTDWDGPYETEQEAREAIESTYDVDPDTGDELGEE
jgi:hypothetical protein